MSTSWGRQHIAKKNTWFKYGTAVFVMNNYGDGRGLFLGTRICENPDSEGYEIDEEYHHRKNCSFDDFYDIGLYQNIGQFLDSIEDQSV